MMQNMNNMSHSFNQSPSRGGENSSELKGQVSFYQEKLNKQIQMYESLKKDTEEQKKFYEEGLEARTKQADDANQQLEMFKSEKEQFMRAEQQLKSQITALKFDNELLTQRLDAGSKDKTDASSREETLLKQLEEVNSILKERESAIEHKVQESFSLKQSIDSMKQE